MKKEKPDKEKGPDLPKRPGAGRFPPTKTDAEPTEEIGIIKELKEAGRPD